jgi:regulator of protease activity HflC (stomatin/prohibitin superfamily)
MLSKKILFCNKQILSRTLSSYELLYLDHSSKLNFGVQIVPKDEVRIIERLGEFDRILKPGFHFLNPITERVSYTHSLKDKMLPIKIDNIYTKDSINISILGNLSIKVDDPEKLSYNVSKPYSNLYKMVRSAVRLESGKFHFKEFTDSRAFFNNRIEEMIDIRVREWGFSLINYEIEEIIPPEDYLKFIRDREKMKEYLKDLDIKHSHENELSKSKSDMENWSIKKIADVKATAITTVADAEALAVTTKAKASLEKAKYELKAFKVLNSDENAAKFALAKEMTEAWKILAEKGPTVLMSGNPSNISRAVAEALATYDSIKKIK